MVAASSVKKRMDLADITRAPMMRMPEMVFVERMSSRNSWCLYRVGLELDRILEN